MLEGSAGLMAGHGEVLQGPAQAEVLAASQHQMSPDGPSSRSHPTAAAWKPSSEN